MTRALIFPGQGSQFVGMGKELAENFSSAKQVFEQVDEALGQKLFALMCEGPEDQLNLTENTQPALMAVSMAVMSVIEAETGKKVSDYAQYVAGHSLGEYAALTAAGALELEQTATLLKIRGQAMQQAVPVGQGSMAAILGLSFEDVQAIAVRASSEAGEEQICEAANDNSEGQVVISGHAAAVQTAVAMASDQGARKAVQLPVSAPFHCTLMAPAAAKMAEALAEATINVPCVPVVANVTAQAETDPMRIRQLLTDQVTGMVRWRESVLWMKDNGITEMAEIGAGKVLSGLVRRIERSIACEPVGAPDQIKSLIEKIN